MEEREREMEHPFSLPPPSPPSLQVQSRVTVKSPFQIQTEKKKKKKKSASKRCLTMAIHNPAGRGVVQKSSLRDLPLSLSLPHTCELEKKLSNFFCQLVRWPRSGRIYFSFWQAVSRNCIFLSPSPSSLGSSFFPVPLHDDYPRLLLPFSHLL